MGIFGQPKLQIEGRISERDPNTCTFTANSQLAEGKAVMVDRGQDASDVPLAERLFMVEGIRRVLIHETTVTVTKEADYDWRKVAPGIGMAMREQHTSGTPAVLRRDDGQVAEVPHIPDQELTVSVQRVIDTEITPMLAQHSGNIMLQRVQDGDVYVQLSGGCQGCGAAALTLAMGITQTLKTRVPGVRRVVDTTDHSAGEKPYISP